MAYLSNIRIDQKCGKSGIAKGKKCKKGAIGARTVNTVGGVMARAALGSAVAYGTLKAVRATPGLSRKLVEQGGRKSAQNTFGNLAVKKSKFTQRKQRASLENAFKQPPFKK